MKLIIDDMIDANENLLLTNKFITGFRLKLTLTSDNIVIVLPSKMNISLTNLTFKEIKKMNQKSLLLRKLLTVEQYTIQVLLNVRQYYRRKVM